MPRDKAEANEEGGADAKDQENRERETSKTRSKLKDLEARKASRVRGGMRKAGGSPSTAGKEFLTYNFDTVFTTK